MKLLVLRSFIYNDSVANAGDVIDVEDEELATVLIGSNKAAIQKEEEKPEPEPFTTENQSALVKGKKKKDA